MYLVRVPWGTQEEDNHYTNAELIERRKMECEIQADEDDERRQKREVCARGSMQTQMFPRAHLRIGIQLNFLSIIPHIFRCPKAFGSDFTHIVTPPSFLGTGTSKLGAED